MLTVLLVVHIMIAVALIGSILLQRSEGGALGIGGGGGGGFMTGRGTANALTRVTALLAAGFFFTSIALTLLARYDHQNASIIDTIGKPAATAPVAPAGGGATAPAGSTAPAPGGSASTAPAGSAAPAPTTGHFNDLQPILPTDSGPAKQP